jgi:hypothetical protein
MVAGIIVFFLVTVAPRFCSGEMFFYSMQYRAASEALPSVQAMLSKDGRAVADPRTNALMIDDDGESIQRIREFLAAFDQLGKQVRVRVKFLEGGSSDSSSVAADARASGSGWTATTDPRKTSDGVDVRLQGRSRENRGSSEYFLSVVSGSAAYIMVGKDVIYTQRWADLTGRHARSVSTVGIQRIETGFEVLPVVLKDHAEIEITPRISHGASGSGRSFIRFAEMTTRLYAPFRQWVTIGGADQGSNEVIREILAAGSRQQGTSLVIRLMVEAD